MINDRCGLSDKQKIPPTQLFLHQGDFLYSFS